MGQCMWFSSPGVGRTHGGLEYVGASDQGEEDVVLGRQHNVGCQSPGARQRGRAGGVDDLSWEVRTPTG